MKALKFNTHNVTTRDNDGDEHESEITYAVVDQDLADQGEEVALRNGEARKLKAGDVVVPVGNQVDVFTADQWHDMWSDSERVSDAGDALKHTKAEREKADQDAADKAKRDEDDAADRAEYEAWKANQKAGADSNDTDPSAPKDDVTSQPNPVTAKKAAASSGKRG